MLLKSLSVNADMGSEWSGGDGEHRRGPAPPQWPAGGQKGVGPGDQPPQTADGGRRSSCSQNQGENDNSLQHSPVGENSPYRLSDTVSLKRVDYLVAGVSAQRRTLIISELENQGALESPLSKQVENLETEIGLRWETQQLCILKLEWWGDKRFNSPVSWRWWWNSLLQERTDRWPSTESPCRWQRGPSQTAHWWHHKHRGGKVRS